MKTAVVSLAVAANLVAATPAGLLPRQDEGSDPAAFTSAANALISAYIPTDQWNSLTSAVGSAASEAGVTADIGSYVSSVLKATTTPEWFANAIPSAFSSQYAALESAIEGLRTTAATVPYVTVVPVTTTDAEGNTVTNSASATITPIATTVTVSQSILTGTDSEGNAYTSTVVPTDATGTADTTATETATATETVTSGTGTATESSEATGTEEPTGSETTGATGTDAESPATSTEAPNAAPTAMANMAGVAALFGLAIVL
ncbi:hypothetical protein CCHL11_08802 [Colletotrichum chlorophyti]|uniref:Uncharacterized protein n=1 Tax=Colletotrichum chlorophyti TaxID=708187 RepID=A0A1Q8RZ94_9PEZI|nr:hypothetical protein CCHL11_08802 [Colletotrichum chlorophyti]